MNQDTLKSILERIDSLENWVASSSKTIESLKIDKQLLVNKDQKLKPGVGCKIAYNSDGLVIGSEALTQSDIPKLSIEKISGLREELDSKYSGTEFTNLQKDLSGVYGHRISSSAFLD